MGLEVGNVVFGYEILSRIGAASTVASFVAVDQTSRRTVVIKELPMRQAQTWSVLEAFRREETLLGRLAHLGVPSLVEAFELGDSYCIVREYLEGQSVGEAVSAGMRLTEHQARSFARQLLRTVIYLEAQGTPALARRITASSVVLRPARPIAFVDFADHTFDEGNTSANALQAVGALVLYVMTGRVPHEGSGLPSPLFELANRHDVSTEFRAWIGRMIAPRPRDRFRSAARALSAITERSLDEKARSKASLAGFARGLLAGACMAAFLFGLAAVKLSHEPVSQTMLTAALKTSR